MRRLRSYTFTKIQTVRSFLFANATEVASVYVRDHVCSVFLRKLSVTTLGRGAHNTYAYTYTKTLRFHETLRVPMSLWIIAPNDRVIVIYAYDKSFTLTF